MTRRVALFAFNGEQMCFVHVLLNGLDMVKRGYDVKLVIEGSACKQVEEMNDPENAFHSLYEQVKDAGLVDCVCKACSNKMGSMDSAVEQGFDLCDELKGHPSVARYMEEGYEIVVF
mgnify:CR=1 FL=1